jgi:hypothetical protein
MTMPDNIEQHEALARALCEEMNLLDAAMGRRADLLDQQAELIADGSIEYAISQLPVIEKMEMLVRRNLVWNAASRRFCEAVRKRIEAG